MPNSIEVKSWNNTLFYFDRWHGTFVAANNSDINNINLHCEESDLESAKDIAIQEGINGIPSLTTIDESLLID